MAQHGNGKAQRGQPRPPLIVFGTGRRLGVAGAEPELITQALSDLTHLHCIGKTGFGKSRLLAGLYVLLLHRGLSATLLDPAGDLARLILRWLVATGFFKQADAFEKFIYLDIPTAARRGLYLPFNVLHPGTAGYDPYTLADMVLEAFLRAFPVLQSGAATNVEILVRTCAHVLAANGLPLLPYMRVLLTNATFRERLLANVTDSEVQSALAQYGFTRTGQPAADVRSTAKKLVQLGFSPLLRYSLGQPANVLDVRALLDGNRSVLSG